MTSLDVIYLEERGKPDFPCLDQIILIFKEKSPIAYAMKLLEKPAVVPFIPKGMELIPLGSPAQKA